MDALARIGPQRAKIKNFAPRPGLGPILAFSLQKSGAWSRHDVRLCQGINGRPEYGGAGRPTQGGELPLEIARGTLTRAELPKGLVSDYGFNQSRR
jgi:hypothetical protein